MWKYAALVSYVGSRYHGWQKQKGSAADAGPSIQETLEQTLCRMTGEVIPVVGSGRTDSGVHSIGQVAHFTLKKKEWDTDILRKGLDSLLPGDIQVLEIRPVSLDFHAQRSAVKKQYSYYYQQGPCAIPHLKAQSWWIQKLLDVEAMSTAFSVLVGEHDFKPFQASGSKPGPTVRRILEAEVTFEPIRFPERGGFALKQSRSPVGLVRVRIVGTGFLKQMVRGIAGTLLQVGENRRDPGCFREILDSQDRSAVGPTAPARGLWKERVWYPERYDLNW